MRDRVTTLLILTICIMLLAYGYFVVSKELSRSIDTSFQCRPGETYTIKECQ